MPPVTDAVLGSRFWLVNDFSPLENAQNPVAPAQGNAPANVKHDATVFSFVANAGDEMVRSAINRAEVFAAQHTLDDRGQMVAEAQAKFIASVLLPGDAKSALLEDAQNIFRDKGLQGNAAELCTKALDKLMLTSEFVRRAEDLHEPLGADGRRALLNAVLGLAKMLGEHRISESAVVELANGNFYDASTTTDLLRLAADSAKKVCEKFVSEAKFKAVISKCEAALKQAKGNMTQGELRALEKRIDQLKVVMHRAIDARTSAVSFIKCDCLFTDPTGSTKSDIAFQEKQIDQIRDSLRAFRYNLDKCRGVSMGRMESVRRFFDNLRSNCKGDTINATSFREMQESDAAFRQLAKGIMDSIPRGGDIANDLRSLSMDEASADATRFSHLTNNRIRYHNSGIEKRQRETTDALRKELSSVVGPGGSRTVSLSISADALIGIDVEWGKLQAKAGMSGTFTASIKVANNGGRVDVTYTKGVDVHGGAEAKLGTSPEDSNALPGAGGKLSGQLKGAYERSVTKTYASIDEFVRTIGPHCRLVNPRFREYIYSLAKGAVRGIGHGILLGLTGLGFRIHRSNMDQVKYAAELRKRDVFGPMSGLLLPRRNTEVLEKTVDSTKSGTIQGEGEVGFYFSNGDGLGTDKKLGGSAQYSYARINRLKHKTYASFAKSLANCTEQFLEQRFRDELARDTDASADAANWKNRLLDVVNGGRSPAAAASAVAEITKMFEDLESEAAGYGKDERERWVGFARRCRMLAAAAALLAKRAEGSPESAPTVKSVHEYLLPRISCPAVQMPEDVFMDEMHNSFDMVLPVKSRHSTRLSFTFDLLGSSSEDLVKTGTNKIGGGNVPADGPVGTGLAAMQGGVAEIGRSMAGLSGTVELLVTKENRLSEVQDKRPWANGNKLTVEAHIPANLPLRLLIEFITRAVVKSKAGTEDIDESKLKSEIKEALLDPLKTEAESALLAGAGKLLETGIGELAKKSSAFAKLLGAITVIGPKYESSDSSYKALRFTFVNGRFSNFTQGEGYDYKGKFSIKTPFFGASFGVSSSTVTNDYSVYTKPSFVDILGVANDYNGAGNPEAFKTFLFRNIKGVKRLMRIVSNRVQEDGDDSRLREDREWFSRMLANLPGQIDRLSTRGTVLGQDAMKLKDSLRSAIEQAQNVDPDGDVDDFVAKTQKLFSTMAKAFGLLAKAGDAN